MRKIFIILAVLSIRSTNRSTISNKKTPRVKNIPK